MCNNRKINMGGFTPKQKGKVTVVLDSQAGSCGKGKFIGYMALRDNPAVAINNFMSNAGHTFVTNDGEAMMTQHLPTSMVNPETILCIGPGSAITPQILIDELLKYSHIIGDRRVYIHPRAMVISSQHAEKEKELIRSGSTFKGCGVAQAEKIMRVPNTQLFGEWYNEKYNETLGGHGSSDNYALSKIEIADTATIVNNAIDNGLDVIIEGSQGCDLDINYGLDYPHCTSRQCHAGQLVADCGISPTLVTDVIMIMRPYPIRISNETNIGITVSSGEYDGSAELSWDTIRDRCGAPKDINFGEFTTVTKKERRVFEMNWDRLKYTAMLNRPTKIALNFAQYLDYDMKDRDNDDEVTIDVLEFMEKVCEITGTPVTLIGTGARNCDIMDIRDMY